MRKYLLLLILPILAFANVGKITVLKGDVKIQRLDKTIQAKSGTVLKKNDFIKTDKTGKVQIVFTDKTVFTIGKNSTLDIADYLYDEAQPKKNKAKFNVLKGAFSSITGRIGKLNKNKFKLKTKSASIGIRGTIIKANQEIIMCTEGAITVTTLNGITVRVEAGQKTNVSTGTPTAPERIQEGDAEKLGTGEDVEDEKKEVAKQEEKKEEKKKVSKKEKETTTENENILATSNEVADVQSDKSSESLSTDITKDAADEIAKKAAEDASKAADEVVDDSTRDLTLQGKTISSDATIQNIQIDVNNINGDLTVSDEDIAITDDQGNVISSTKDETITWGHWVDDPAKKWVAGQVTDVQVLDNMRNDQTKTVNAEYTGQSMGTVNGSDDIKIDGNNEVKINFALGGGKNSMDGTMKFDTKSGQSWNSNFSGTTSGTTFSSTSVGGSAAGSDNAEAISSGNVDGSFYGSDAQAVGGVFKLETESDKATGVFKATK